MGVVVLDGEGEVLGEGPGVVHHDEVGGLGGVLGRVGEKVDEQGGGVVGHPVVGVFSHLDVPLGPHDHLLSHLSHLHIDVLLLLEVHLEAEVEGVFLLSEHVVVGQSFE